MSFFLVDEWIHQPTFEVASVKLFSVVLLPEDGLPTKPIKGSRGMLSESMMLRCIKPLEFLEASAGKD